MSKHPAEPGTAQSFVEQRRARILGTVGARPDPAAAVGTPTPAERLDYFRSEAEELYWNELAWEQMTDEEAVGGGHLTEMVFPGFLAFIDALLHSGAAAEEGTGARCYPDAVEEILTLLGERCAELSADLAAGADSQKLVWARAMTLRLVDLVLFRLYGLSRQEREAVESRD